MHVANNISPTLRGHFEKMVADGAIIEADFDAFLKNPRLWRPAPRTLLAPEAAQAFWQGVWDEVGLALLDVVVPPVPKLTLKQVKSLDKFGFLLVYLPQMSVLNYPARFTKPAWGKYLKVAGIERLLLAGQWVAVETIAKPHSDDPKGYPNDRLMVAVKHPKRFTTSHDALTGGLLAQIAKTTGFPKKGTRLPSAEEWTLAGNLFNWLREHRQMDLPDLGSTNSWEWCQNAYNSDDRLVVGRSDGGGLSGVHRGVHGHGYGSYGFRVLVVL